MNNVTDGMKIEKTWRVTEGDDIQNIIVTNVTNGMRVEKTWRITEEEDIQNIIVTNVTIGMRVEETWKITEKEDIQRNVRRNLYVGMKRNSKRERSIEVELYVIFVRKNLRIRGNEKSIGRRTMRALYIDVFIWNVKTDTCVRKSGENI